jgi:hypothetical protein
VIVRRVQIEKYVGPGSYLRLVLFSYMTLTRLAKTVQLVSPHIGVVVVTMNPWPCLSMDGIIVSAFGSWKVYVNT